MVKIRSLWGVVPTPAKYRSHDWYCGSRAEKPHPQRGVKKERYLNINAPMGDFGAPSPESPEKLVDK